MKTTKERMWMLIQDCKSVILGGGAVAGAVILDYTTIGAEHTVKVGNIPKDAATEMIGVMTNIWSPDRVFHYDEAWFKVLGPGEKRPETEVRKMEGKKEAIVVSAMDAEGHHHVMVEILRGWKGEINFGDEQWAPAGSVSVMRFLSRVKLASDSTRA